MNSDISEYSEFLSYPINNTWRLDMVDIFNSTYKQQFIDQADNTILDIELDESKNLLENLNYLDLAMNKDGAKNGAKTKTS